MGTARDVITVGGGHVAIPSPRVSLDWSSEQPADRRGLPAVTSTAGRRDADRSSAFWRGCLVVAGTLATLLPISLILGVDLAVAAAVPLGVLLLGRAVRSPRWAVLTFVLVIPVGLSEALALGPVDLVQVLAAGVVLLVAWQRMLAGQAPLRWHPSAGWAVALAVMAVISSVTALDVMLGVRQTAALVVAVALALAVNAACAGGPDLRHVVLVLATVGAGVCLYSLTQSGDIEAVADNAGAVENRAVGIFSSPNELGNFSGMLMMVGIGLAVGARTRRERIMGGACAVTAAAALTVSLSRGAWIGAVLAVALLALLSVRARHALAVVLGIVVVVTPLAMPRMAPELWDVVRERAVSVAEPEANPDDARPLIYAEARRQIMQKPLTGQGPGNYPVASQTAESIAPVNVLHAHNVILAVAAETGLPGAAALSGLTLSVAWRVLQVRSRLPVRDADLMLGLSLSLVVMVGQGLVDFVFRNPTLLFLVWVLLGLVFAATRPQTQPDAPARSAVPQPSAR
ncbi:O-antigen ligase family protein [Geodermatophilus maliterrae]|uniref:O-antigen ligase family protein n=1 Tax=Geodermatophilus maliterrae TaxID=3162531 RepID=A0ABV3XIW4_9ACTN